MITSVDPHTTHLRATRQDAVTSAGPDIGQTPATSEAISVGQSFGSAVDFVGDSDWYRISLDAGAQIMFALDGASEGGGTLSDPLLRLYDMAGTLIDADDDGGPGLNSLLNFTVPTGGDYFIAAEGYGANTGTYTLSVREVLFNPNDGWIRSPGFASPVLNAISWGTRFERTDLTVYFGPAGYSAGGVTSEGFTAFEKQQFHRAFDAIQAVANLTFTTVTSGVGADLEMILDTDELSDIYGRFNPPGFGGAGNDGVGFFAGNLWDRFAGGDLTVGGFGYYTIMHELLHGLGLAHPHDNGGGSSVLPGVQYSRDDFGDFDLNQGLYTTMSYNPGYHTGGEGTAPPDGTGDGQGIAHGYAAGPMAADIAVLQGLYGTNAGFRTGNDVYVLPEGSGSGVYWSTIWDAGGLDTIRHTGTEPARIDLRAATLKVEEGGAGFISAVDGTSGGFTIAAGAMIENAVGGRGADTIFGNRLANHLIGGEGFDTIHAGDGADIVDGGEGNDRLFGESGDDRLFGGRGFDRIEGGDGNDLLKGGDSYDQLFGGAGDDLILGGINIGTAKDLLVGGTGNDTLLGQGGFDLLRGGDGQDLLKGGGQADNLYGDRGRDTLRGEGGFDRLFGGSGDDLLDGGAGPDALYGQTGNDTMVGAAGNDRFYGGLGNDTIRGGDGNDRISGNAGFDHIDSGRGDDLIFGGYNADTFIFGPKHGHDVLADFTPSNAFEMIDFRGLGSLDGFDRLVLAAREVSQGVLIDTGGSSSVLLRGVALGTLTADDFLF